MTGIGKFPPSITMHHDLDQPNEPLDKLEGGPPVRMKYVVLGTASLATIKQTHGRYFVGDYEVVNSIVSRGGVKGGGAWNRSFQ